MDKKYLYSIVEDNPLFHEDFIRIEEYEIIYYTKDPSFPQETLCWIYDGDYGSHLLTIDNEKNFLNKEDAENGVIKYLQEKESYHIDQSNKYHKAWMELLKKKEK